MAYVTDYSLMGTIQSEPTKTLVQVFEQNPNIDGTTADGVGVDAVANELAIVPVPKRNGSEQVQIGQKRRGRPRKYDSDGNIISFGNSAKKSRGRPRGSARLQTLGSTGDFLAETAGGSFVPNVLTISTGEDVVSRIISFSHRASSSVSLISATGAVSSVVLALRSGVTLTYEGRFEILYFTGSFTYGGMGGAHYKTGALSISLAKQDGIVFGGHLQGPMIAASPIQLVVGTFKQYLVKEIRRKCIGERSNSRKQPAVNVDWTTPAANVSEVEAEMMAHGHTWASPTPGLMPTPTSPINGSVAYNDSVWEW